MYEPPRPVFFIGSGDPNTTPYAWHLHHLLHQLLASSSIVKYADKWSLPGYLPWWRNSCSPGQLSGLNGSRLLCCTLCTVGPLKGMPHATLSKCWFTCLQLWRLKLASDNGQFPWGWRANHPGLRTTDLEPSSQDAGIITGHSYWFCLWSIFFSCQSKTTQTQKNLPVIFLVEQFLPFLQNIETW